MIGILFATEMEAKPFLDRGEPEGTVVLVSGMGMAAARTATLELIEKHGCTSVINAGVCGALDDSLERGSVHRVSVVNVDDPASAGSLVVEDSGKRLVTVEEPVFQPNRKKELSAFGELVDMEGYAVARVCEERNIPCIMVKGVTDFGDHNGKDDIQKHIDSVSESVADAIALECGGNRRATPLLARLHSFTKIEHTIFSLPLLFAGAWLGAEDLSPVKALLLIALVGLGARTFGMAVNRILDKNIDAKNPRTKNRELPSGKLSMAQGYGVAIVGLVIYFVGCALLGSTVLKLSLVPLVPLALYSLLKRFTPLCHYGIGICLAAAPLGAFVAVTNSLAFTPEVWLLAIFTFCWISGFDIIYALLDIDFDRANGVCSIPASLGSTGAQWVAAITHLVSFVALVLLWMSVGGTLSFVALLVSAAAFGAAYLPGIPVHVRFFPVSAIAGIAGALVVLLG